MTPELTVLALAALWQAVQIGVAGMALNADVGAAWNAGPRDSQPALSPLTGRLRRAVNNHSESLILFTVAVIVVTLSESRSDLSIWAAFLYLAARILYLPAYAFGWTPWRSLIWAVGFAASLAMILAGIF